MAAQENCERDGERETDIGGVNMREIAQMDKQQRTEMNNQIDDIMRSFGVSDDGIADFWDILAFGLECHTKAILDTC